MKEPNVDGVDEFSLLDYLSYGWVVKFEVQGGGIFGLFLKW